VCHGERNYRLFSEISSVAREIPMVCFDCNAHEPASLIYTSRRW
jgi:hypothetical protein